MFFKRNGNRKRRPAPADTTLSPRFARLLRDSWCLLVVAILIYVALILGSYTRSDPGFSFTGTGAPMANRGGVVGAWLSDLMLYLFGLSAWWWVVGGLVLLVAGLRRVAQPDVASDHPRVLALFGFGLVLLASASLEAVRLWKLAVTLPLAPGGALGESIGRALTRAFGF